MLYVWGVICVRKFEESLEDATLVMDFFLCYHQADGTAASGLLTSEHLSVVIQLMAPQYSPITTTTALL